MTVGMKKSLINNETEEKISELLDKMTVIEKVGQMTQYGKCGEKEIGQVGQGRVGSLLNIRGAKETNQIQRIAVEESRLGIPLIFGDDVIHGYKTIFPIPLAESCSWDTEVFEKSSEVAAKEASVS